MASKGCTSPYCDCNRKKRPKVGGLPVLKCAVCLWTMPRVEDMQDAVTISNGTAVCQGHLHLTADDPARVWAKRMRANGVDPYQPEGA